MRSNGISTIVACVSRVPQYATARQAKPSDTQRFRKYYWCSAVRATKHQYPREWATPFGCAKGFHKVALMKSQLHLICSCAAPVGLTARLSAGSSLRCLPPSAANHLRRTDGRLSWPHFVQGIERIFQRHMPDAAEASLRAQLAHLRLMEAKGSQPDTSIGK